MPTGAEGSLTRRGLFGAGLARALDARFAEEPQQSAARPAAGGVTTAGEADGARLGTQLSPVAARVLEVCDLKHATPRRVVVVGAGDGTPLAALAADLGHDVTAVEPDDALRERGAGGLPSIDWHSGTPAALPVEAGAADAVLAWFGAAYHPDPRAMAREVRRVAAPGAAIALTAWSAAAQKAVGRLRGPRAHRPDQWSRYETAYRHFFDMPALDVIEEAVDVVLDQGGDPVSLGYGIVTVRNG